MTLEVGSTKEISFRFSPTEKAVSKLPIRGIDVPCETTLEVYCGSFLLSAVCNGCNSLLGTSPQDFCLHSSPSKEASQHPPHPCNLSVCTLWQWPKRDFECGEERVTAQCTFVMWSTVQQCDDEEGHWEEKSTTQLQHTCNQQDGMWCITPFWKKWGQGVSAPGGNGTLR